MRLLTQCITNDIILGNDHLSFSIYKCTSILVYKFVENIDIS